MRRMAVCSMGLALMAGTGAPSSAADSPRKQQLEEWARREMLIDEIADKAERLAPRRRDEPLRDANITDIEVREIQALVHEHLPNVIVNIGPVVTGCPCEEGAGCTEQVYLQANTAQGTTGLLLSRVGRRWDISRLQKWWWQWRRLKAIEHRLDYFEFRERAWELARVFPACTRDDASPEKIAARPRAEPRK